LAGGLGHVSNQSLVIINARGPWNHKGRPRPLAAVAGRVRLSVARPLIQRFDFAPSPAALSASMAVVPGESTNSERTVRAVFVPNLRIFPVLRSILRGS